VGPTSLQVNLGEDGSPYLTIRWACDSIVRPSRVFLMCSTSAMSFCWQPQNPNSTTVVTVDWTTTWQHPRRHIAPPTRSLPSITTAAPPPSPQFEFLLNSKGEGVVWLILRATEEFMFTKPIWSVKSTPTGFVVSSKPWKSEKKHPVLIQNSNSKCYRWKPVSLSIWLIRFKIQISKFN
jgi:hypothetical protein